MTKIIYSNEQYIYMSLWLHKKKSLRSKEVSFKEAKRKIHRTDLETQFYDCTYYRRYVKI